MKPVSAEVVEDIWQDMSALEPDEAVKLVETMGKEQPAILAYLMAAGMDDLTQSEHELLLYTGMVVWQMMKEESATIPKITEKALDQAESKNIKMLEYLSEEPDHDFIHTINTMWEGYNQQEVLKYVIETLLEEVDDEELLQPDEHKAYMFICLKTLVDCFDQAVD